MIWKNERRKIKDLIPAEYNPRQLTEKQAKDLERSLKNFNLCDPIIINKDNKIIGGHQRISILKTKNIDEVDVRVPDRQLDEMEEKELNIRLNKNLGEWDYDALANFDQDFLLDIGFESDELDRIFQLEPDAKDDEVPDVPEEAETKLGDLYILGRHRLMCGDSTKVDDVERLMDGKKADMVFTDPPYNANYNPDNSPRASSRTDKSKMNKRKMGGIKNDAMTQDNYDIFLNQVFSNMVDSLNEGSAFYLCCNYPSDVDYTNALRKLDVNISCSIIWDKGALILDRKDYHASHEKILYGWRKGKRHNFVGGHSKKDLWLVKRDSFREYKHPTQKPCELVSTAILNHSVGLILDLFLGSGSTLIACEKTNRICYGMELDERYCDVIVKRWEEYTGQTASKQRCQTQKT